jgi:hypothetical protein
MIFKRIGRRDQDFKLPGEITRSCRKSKIMIGTGKIAGAQLFCLLVLAVGRDDSA